jgi:hypothetical protein
MSVHTDIIELNSGELLRGRVYFDGDGGAEVALCGDTSVPRKSILKITSLGSVPDEPGAKHVIIYAMDAAGEFQVLWCDGISASVSFKDALTEDTRNIPFSEIKDIVMALKPYWS